MTKLKIKASSSVGLGVFGESKKRWKRGASKFDLDCLTQRDEVDKQQSLKTHQRFKKAKEHDQKHFLKSVFGQPSKNTKTPPKRKVSKSDAKPSTENEGQLVLTETESRQSSTEEEEEEEESTKEHSFTSIIQDGGGEPKPSRRVTRKQTATKQTPLSYKPKLSPLNAGGTRFSTKPPWAPRHIFDHIKPSRKNRCTHCKKKMPEYRADVYNIMTSESTDSCAKCCVKEYSSSTRLLVDCLGYLTHEGLYGTLDSISEFKSISEYVFELEQTPRVLRLVDVFRWFFTFSPFERRGSVVRVTVVPFRAFAIPLTLMEKRYHMKLVPGAWAPEFHSNGVTLFATSIEEKAPPMKKKKEEERD